MSSTSAQTRRVLTGDSIAIDRERVRALAQSIVALGMGRPTEEVMAALELAVASLMRAAWAGRERPTLVRQFMQNISRTALQR
jgi:hypothetical protein